MSNKKAGGKKGDFIGCVTKADRKMIANHRKKAGGPLERLIIKEGKEVYTFVDFMYGKNLTRYWWFSGWCGCKALSSPRKGLSDKKALKWLVEKHLGKYSKYKSSPTP